MKIGLKSYLLPRFFPISCSGEFQSCCAGETGHVGDMWVTPLRSGSALGVSFCSLAPRRVVLFSGSSALRDLAGRCTCCEGQNVHRAVETFLATEKWPLQRRKKHCKVRPAQGDSWGNRVKGQGLAPLGRAAWGEQVRQKPEVREKEPPSARTSSQLPPPRAVLPGE